MCWNRVVSMGHFFPLIFSFFFYRKNKSQQANLLSALIHFHFDRSFYSVFADAVNFFYFWRHKFMIVQFYSSKCQNRKSNQAQSLLKLVVIIRQWFFLHSLEFISIFLISIQHESSCEWKKSYTRLFNITKALRNEYFLRDLIDCNLSLANAKKAPVFCALNHHLLVPLSDVE